MFYNYIIKSTKTGEYYKGFSDDVDRRVQEHQLGKVESTKNKCPWIIIHVEITELRSDALKLEKFFKSGYGREIIEQINTELTN